MSTFDLRRSTASTSPVRQIGRRSASAAHLVATPSDSPESIRAFNKRFGSATTFGNEAAISRSLRLRCSKLLIVWFAILNRLIADRYSELQTLIETLKRWQNTLRRRNNHRSSLTRSSLFHTPSSTASEELDDNVLMVGDFHSENDSGIDSAKAALFTVLNDAGHKKYVESAGRKDGKRFKQMKERRKSLGAMLDPVELERMYLESDRFWETADEDPKGTVTGNAEIDVCLRYHLSRVNKCLQVGHNTVYL
ncbi:hypothetical protein KIN20_034075 [Parelaphostrongylus tenuis]|uniref:Uncharacterized protein n=1 Tax=Parelaphostrongylus tenuis TaxID=148309 RepID=A0AAD5WJF9_PARTN|nr:hypothetical protein KIN20_034075 [Parelaphostrongylus tenuis]